MGHRHGDRLGIDEHQAIARRAAGYSLPRARTPKPTDGEKMVEGIIAVECRHCGCTSAKVPAKKTDCPFCGRTL